MDGNEELIVEKRPTNMARKRQRNSSGAAKEEPKYNHQPASIVPVAELASPIKKKSKQIHESADATLNGKVHVSDDAPANCVTAAEAKKKKKKKNKKTSQSASTSAAQSSEQKPNQAAKSKKSSEIDDLFQSLKTNKQAKALADEKKKQDEAAAQIREQKEKKRLQEQIKKLEAQNTNSNAASMNPDPRPVRYDEDGLPIYTEASLQIGKGGDTKDSKMERNRHVQGFYGQSAHSQRRKTPKRRGSFGSNDDQTSHTMSCSTKKHTYQPQNVVESGSSLFATKNATEIRAFGLEDRAEAVIAMGKNNWSLSNLPKWRKESLLGNGIHGNNNGGDTASREYLRQRQRAYRQQMISRSSNNANT